MKPELDLSKRHFLLESLLSGAALLAGSAALTSCGDTVEETGEKVKLLSQDGQLIEVDAAYIKHPASKARSIGRNLAEREGIPGKKFVMVIDLARCKNARNDLISHTRIINTEVRKNQKRKLAF